MLVLIILHLNHSETCFELTKTKIKKINLENAYYDAITNSKSNFGVDDLNILIGDFKGNYNKLQKITQIKFESVMTY